MPTDTTAAMGPATTALPDTALADPALADKAPADTAPAGPDIDVARLRAAIMRLSRRLRKHDLADLTPTQLSALATVARDGPLKLGDLAAAERIAPSTLTRLVSALGERGYLARGPVPGDARASMVSVTEAGTLVLRRIKQETTALLTDSLLTLPPDQLAALAAALPALEHLGE
ncbi:MAG: MarR family winged helix-turn-helix transcriptional regulator [Streptosporangiaceae bacterium]